MSAATTLGVTLRYAAQSEVKSDPRSARVELALDGGRGTVGLRGKVRDPALLRDALMTTIAILRSDLRYKGRDRTAYLAYLMKKGKKATAATWEAQKAFLEQAFSDEKKEKRVLDPVWTVDPDGASLEVFSQDESSYARLSLSKELFLERQAAHGTSFVDLSPSFSENLDRMRSYAPTEFEAGVNLTHKSNGEERAVDVPMPWLRGFLQVQSAATLPAATAVLAPIDLYNLLFALRTHKAKKSPRALRFELVPGAPPRMIVEPWELLLECHAGPYQGRSPRVVRTFGRQRLMALARLLPYVKSARVQMVGAGLPVFWVLDLGLATLTLALTGWTESGWAAAGSFDALMPSAGSEPLAEKVVQALGNKGPLSWELLQKEVDATPSALRSAVQLASLRGRVLYDLAGQQFRPRDLFAQGVDDKLIRYGSEAEARAHRLLGDGAPGEGDVKITKVHDIHGEGVEVHGEVVDKQAQRTIGVRFTIDLEGRIKDAWDNSPQYRRSGMREGPSPYMIAVRLAFARRRAEEEALRQTPEGRATIRAETRTYVRRALDGKEQVFRLSLDGKTVQVRWGERNATPRQQRLWFDTDREAREAYFARVEELTGEGYIDADVGVA